MAAKCIEVIDGKRDMRLHSLCLYIIGGKTACQVHIVALVVDRAFRALSDFGILLVILERTYSSA